ncbi:hypothetical protein JW835_16740 [bacterium]|nr:hypothetical protein [bacterium]
MHKKSGFIQFRFGLFIFFILTFSIFAETWFVYQKIENSGSGLNWIQAKKTIHEAVDISMPGDTILVGYNPDTGTEYTISEPIHIGHPLKIWSAKYYEDLHFGLIQHDSSLCVLDAQGSCRIFLIRSRNDTLNITPFNTQIIGFTLINGDATGEMMLPGHGGAICITGKTSPSFSQCQITENYASKLIDLPGYGGGICCVGDSAFPVFRYTSVIKNTASMLCAGFGGGIAVLDSASINIYLSSIKNNLASASETEQGEGGGIYCSGRLTSSEISMTVIRQNSGCLKSQGYGGGICISEGAKSAVHHCTIDSNYACKNNSTSSSYGGGICCYGDSTEPVIENNIISSNMGSQTSRGLGGGLAMMKGAGGIVQYNEINNNMATASANENGAGGGIFCSGNMTSPFLAFNMVLQNTASMQTGGRGGGICVADSASPLIMSCTIDSNTASKNSPVFSGFGGGICACGDSTYIKLFDNVIKYNLAAGYAGGSGGGIACIENASGQITGNQILENTASLSSSFPGYGGGIILDSTRTDPIVSNNIIQKNQAAVQAPGYGGGICVFHSANPLIKENSILQNIASSHSGGFGGGMICGYEGTQPIIQKNQIQENSSSVNASGFGGGIYLFKAASAVCKQNTIMHNFASCSKTDFGLGGGICCENQTDKDMILVLHQNRFEHNIANKDGHGRGGALACDGGGPKNMLARYNLFLQNMGTAGSDVFGWGGAVYLGGDNLQTVIRNNHFINNYENSISHIDGQGSVFYLAVCIPDTSIRNNLYMANDSLINISNTALYSTIPVTITHNAFYGYPTKYNSQVTSQFEVSTYPDIDPVTMIPNMNSPLLDAGFDPVLNINETQSGWFIDIGAYEFAGALIQKIMPPSQTISFEGLVRARIQNTTFNDTIRTTIQTHLKSRHPLAFYTIPRWYQIECIPHMEGTGMLTLSYTDSECNGLDEHSLRLWHFDIRENQWDGPLFSKRDTTANWVQAPFRSLSGDWIITDAKDLNALSLKECNLRAQTKPEGLLVSGYMICHPDVISAMLCRSDDGYHFVRLNDSKVVMDPGNSHYEFTYLDNNINRNQPYFYKMEWTYRDGNIGYSDTIEAVLIVIPKKSILLPNYPDPFNHETRIHFLLAKEEKITIDIWDLKGRLVKILSQKSYPPGEHTLPWDGSDASQISVSSGVYVYRLKTPSFQQCGKMVLLR